MATADDSLNLVNLPDDIKAVIEEGKNKMSLKCQRCPSLILKSKTGKYVQKEFFLPHMKKKSDEQRPEDGEMLYDFWQVDGMFTFENVGFSNNVGTTKFLICADCEVGPIGYQDTRQPNDMFVAIDRIKHEET